MEKAAFCLKSYTFEDVELHLGDFPQNATLGIDIKPKGIYNQSNGIYELDFIFTADIEDKNIASVLCKAIFEFSTPTPFGSIPSFFYSNSIAIVFPYVRAFISTLTLQANVKPIVLPTMNLSSLSDTLRTSTNVIGNED